jgi:hypothetical protein
MSDGSRGRRAGHWFMLLALTAIWLGLAHKDQGDVPGSITVVQLQPNGQPAKMLVQLPNQLPSPLRAVVAFGPSVQPGSSAQSAPAPPAQSPGPALCGAEMVDSSVTFAHDASHQLLTVEFRNLGAAPCRLGADPRFAASNIAEQSGLLKIASCYRCGTMPPAMEPVTLEPGQATALRLDWPTEAAATPGSCRDADSIGIGIGKYDRTTPGPGINLELYTGKLRLCPPVNYGPYRPVEPAAPVPVRLALSADQPDYYPDELMHLHLAAEDPGHALAKAFDSCSNLFLLTKLRQPAGQTRLTMIAVPPGRNMPHLPANGTHVFANLLRGDWQPDLEPSVTTSFPSEMTYFVGTGLTAEHEASYVSTCGGWATVARSADLETRVIDGPPAPPRWGVPTDGFALALAADRDRYPLGRDVPLRISCTRFARDWSVEGSTEVPLCWAKLEVVDEAGTVVPASDTEFFPLMTHGWRGTRHVEADAVVEEPTSLATEGHLPARPGTYRVTATWLAHDDDDKSQAPRPVRSPPLTLTIADPGQ